MTVNDRGNIKWTAMMMPEHHQLLHQMWAQQEREEKPELDEQQVEEINMKLQVAIHNDLFVIIKYFSNHNFKTIRGKLEKVVSPQNYLVLRDGTKIQLDNIIDLQID
ncbi:YolD-like family protein [Paucisalibacillus globulus]|uniref:YolD-like family protein n=1 Tax=Paucisalibacillus globulus TaxID=351095 RepID=UPI0004079C93|nr:YolD-like family protein [Paucisalibacillus globulus]